MKFIASCEPLPACAAGERSEGEFTEIPRNTGRAGKKISNYHDDFSLQVNLAQNFVIVKPPSFENMHMEKVDYCVVCSGRLAVVS